MYSKEDIDYWIDVLARIVRRGLRGSADRQGRRRTTRRSTRSDVLGARGSRALGHDVAGLSAQASFRTGCTGRLYWLSGTVL